MGFSSVCGMFSLQFFRRIQTLLRTVPSSILRGEVLSNSFAETWIGLVAGVLFAARFVTYWAVDDLHRCILQDAILRFEKFSNVAAFDSHPAQPDPERLDSAILDAAVVGVARDAEGLCCL